MSYFTSSIEGLDEACHAAYVDGDLALYDLLNRVLIREEEQEMRIELLDNREELTPVIKDDRGELELNRKVTND